jgi:hypothetical protein
VKKKIHMLLRDFQAAQIRRDSVKSEAIEREKGERKSNSTLIFAIKNNTPDGRVACLEERGGGVNQRKQHLPKIAMPLTLFLHVAFTTVIFDRAHQNVCNY